MLIFIIVLFWTILLPAFGKIVTPHVLLFENPNLQGKSLELKGFSHWDEGILARYDFDFANYVCIKGLWLLYEKILLSGNVEAAFGDGDTFFCFQPKMSNLTSIRPIPTISPPPSKQRDTLYVFRRILVESYFYGGGFITVDNMIFEDTDNLRTIMAFPAESRDYRNGLLHNLADHSQLVAIGTSSWTLYSDYNYTGPSVCLYSNPKSTTLTADPFGPPVIAFSNCCFDFRIKSIRKGCFSENTINLNVTAYVRTRPIFNPQMHVCSFESHPGNDIASGLKHRHVSDMAVILESIRVSAVVNESKIEPGSNLIFLDQFLQASLNVFYSICGEDSVQQLFLEKVKAVFLFYVKEISRQFSNQLEPQNKFWTESTQILQSCLNSVQPLNFILNPSRGKSYPTSIYGVNIEKFDTNKTDTSSTSTLHSMKVALNIEKIAVTHQNLDPVIDTIWFGILGSLRACSIIAQDSLKILKIFKTFVDTVLKPMKNLWREPGTCSYVMNKQLFKRNSDRPIMMRNINICTEAILLGMDEKAAAFGKLGKTFRPIPYQHNGQEYANEEILVLHQGYNA